MSSLDKSLGLNRAQLPPGVRVEVQRLLFEENDADSLGRGRGGANSESHLQGKRLEPFDLIVAADVLFFERFHRALLHTLHSYLDPERGEAWLLQPSRGGSLERFVDLLREEKGWQVSWEGERAGCDDSDDGRMRLQLIKLRRKSVKVG